MRLSMDTALKFNRGTVTKHNVCCQNINENIKKILDMQHTRTRFTITGKSVYANLQDECVAL